MHVRYSLLASQATTAIFVLLWGSAAIFTRWGLDNASPMALLVFRFLIALVALAPLAIVRRRWLPAPGTRLQTAATGLMLIGGYSVCYFEAMANGVTPGLIATMMGIQPILTLCVVERRLQGRRLLGLLLIPSGHAEEFEELLESASPAVIVVLDLLRIDDIDDAFHRILGGIRQIGIAPRLVRSEMRTHVRSELGRRSGIGLALLGRPGHAVGSRCAGGHRGGQHACK